MSARPGVGMVEVIVSMVLVGTGVFALAGTALHAQRSFAEAAAREAAVHAASALIDSLAAAPSAASGSQVRDGIALSWTVQDAARMQVLEVSVSSRVGGRVLTSRWRVTQAQ